MSLVVNELTLTAPQRPAASPVLKWAGGKTQLLAQLSSLFPPRAAYGKYLEPFVGSGAVFFHLRPQKAVLADNNEELVNCYKQIQKNVDDVIKLLREHKRLHEKKYYYKVRAHQFAQSDFIKRAARFIYLNKTCFNGLYRVNSRGAFNVPMGRYDNPPILDERGLEQAHDALRGVRVHRAQFDSFCNEFAERGDFIYFDPPYVPLSPTSNFTSYTKDSFGLKDQERLRDLFERLDKQGCLLMLSNSGSNLVRHLYKQYQRTTYEVSARRAINSVPNKRTPVTELVILNYQPS